MVQDRLPAFQNGDTLISVDQLEISEMDVYRASLMSNVLFAWSNTLVSSHSTGAVPRWFSAMAYFSVSPRLVAAFCSFMRVSRALFISPIYIWPQLQGIWYTTPDFFSSGSWSLTLISCPQRMDANRKTVWMLYLLHSHLTSSLRPATYGMNAVAQGSSAASVAVWGLLTVFTRVQDIHSLPGFLLGGLLQLIP